MTSHTHSPQKTSKSLQPDPDSDIRGASTVPITKVSVSMTVTRPQRGMREAGGGATKKCSKKERTPPAPLTKPRILRQGSYLCVLGLLRIPSALLEPNCLQGPISSIQAEKLTTLKLKCACSSVWPQNDLSLLNGISYMCWVR